jgi:hypothetical protein
MDREREDIEMLARALCRAHETGASDQSPGMTAVINNAVDENWSKWLDEAKKLVDDIYEPLLDACKQAYRKHVLEDAEIGWEKLGDNLNEALVNTMGDDAYNKWMDSLEK